MHVCVCCVRQLAVWLRWADKTGAMSSVKMSHWKRLCGPGSSLTLTESTSFAERWSSIGRRAAAGADGGRSCFLAEAVFCAEGVGFFAVPSAAGDRGETLAAGVALADFCRLALGGLPDASEERRLAEAGSLAIFSPGLGVFNATDRGVLRELPLGLLRLGAAGVADGLGAGFCFLAYRSNLKSCVSPPAMRALLRPETAPRLCVSAADGFSSAIFAPLVALLEDCLLTPPAARVSVAPEALGPPALPMLRLDEASRALSAKRIRVVSFGGSKQLWAVFRFWTWPLRGHGGSTTGTPLGRLRNSVSAEPPRDAR